MVRAAPPCYVMVTPSGRPDEELSSRRHVSCAPIMNWNRFDNAHFILAPKGPHRLSPKQPFE
jgi:hypothetical protein